MPIRKLRKISGGGEDGDPQFGVVIPRDELRHLGLLNDEGELKTEEQVFIDGDLSEGEWTIELVDDRPRVRA